MQNFNYHTHTYRCGHAQKDMTDEDFVQLFIQIYICLIEMNLVKLKIKQQK